MFREKRKIKITSFSDDRPMFVIGDVHGCYIHLTKMLDQMSSLEDLSQCNVLFVGDYVDRGPDSRKTVELLLGFQRQYPHTIFLRGNHEDMLLDFLGFDGNYGEWFLYNGGKKTFKDYNLDRYVKTDFEGKGYSKIAKSSLAKMLPQEHLIFFQSLYDAAMSDKFIVVHAGVSFKTKTLEQNTTETLFWTRNDFFLEAKREDLYLGRMIVHGHTIETVRQDYHNRINVDTGAFKERGTLTALYYKDNKVNFLQTKSTN